MLHTYGSDVSIESVKEEHDNKTVHMIDVTFPDMVELNNNQTVDFIQRAGTHADILAMMQNRLTVPAFFVDGCPSQLIKKLYVRFCAILPDATLLVRTCTDVHTEDCQHKFSRWTQALLKGKYAAHQTDTWFEATQLTLDLDARMRQTMQWENASTRNAILDAMDDTIPHSKKGCKRIVNKGNAILDAEALCMAAFMSDDNR